MSEDILNTIDETLSAVTDSMQRNAARFDPFGPDPKTFRRSITEEEPEPAEAVSPMLEVSRPTSSRVSFADVAAGPSNGGDPETVDIRRRVQDGTAPAQDPGWHVLPFGSTVRCHGPECSRCRAPEPDHVADAMLAEVLRQGLIECEIDGVRHEYTADGWLLLDETHVWRQRLAEAAGIDPVAFRRMYLNEPVEALRPEACGLLPTLVLPDASSIGPCCLPAGHPSWRWHIDEGGTSWRDAADQPEPVSPLVDAALEPEEQIEALRQQRAATYAEVDRLLAETETVLALIEMLPAPRLPWWKRWFR